MAGLSATVKRVVRSTLAAEAYAVSEGVESLQYIRALLLELVSDPSKVGLRQIESFEQQPLGSMPPPDCGTDAAKDGFQYTVYLRTDSDNLSKSLHKDSGSVKDKRLRIVISMLRETLELEPWVKVQWAPTHEMVADCLTKVDSPLLPLFEAFMRSSLYKYPAASGSAQRTFRTSEWSNVRALHALAASPAVSGKGENRGRGGATSSSA